MSIDVERLAQAMHEAGAMCYRPREFCKREWIDDPRHDIHMGWATAVAREYDRLAPADTGLREAAQAVVEHRAGSHGITEYRCGHSFDAHIAALRAALIQPEEAK